MSNVLIGIIGVILFIGLAIAGALFLGPRFQESTNNSKAAAAVQALKQIGDAVSLHDLQEGSRLSGNGSSAEAEVSTLVAKGYLKSVPRAPFTGANMRINVDERYVVAELPVSGSNNAAICNAIAKQTGSIKAVYPEDEGAPPTTVRTTCISYDGGREYDVLYRY